MKIRRSDRKPSPVDHAQLIAAQLDALRMLAGAARGYRQVLVECGFDDQPAQMLAASWAAAMHQQIVGKP